MHITVGLVGLGNIAVHHIRAIEKLPAYRITAVCDTDADKRDRWALELRCRAFADFAGILAERPDLVVVALPHWLHSAATIEALRAGCHVLVEKPMATSVDECNAMLRAAKAAGRRLFVAETANFDPGAVLTGEKFRSGTLGRFLTGALINFRHYFAPDRPEWFLDPGKSGGGMFANVGVHRLALARTCLAGLEPVRVDAVVSRPQAYPVEACTSVFVRYRGGGAMLYEEVGYFPKPDWLPTAKHFVFEEGIVSWDAEAWRMQSAGGQEFLELLRPAEPYVGLYESLLDAFSGGTGPPPARAFAQDVAIVHAAYASAREGTPQDLDDPRWRISDP